MTPLQEELFNMYSKEELAYELAIFRTKNILLNKRIDSMEKETRYLKLRLVDAEDNLLDCFEQACCSKDGYDHMCLSSYEDAQLYLIKHGAIKESNCVR